MLRWWRRGRTPPHNLGESWESYLITPSQILSTACTLDLRHRTYPLFQIIRLVASSPSGLLFSSPQPFLGRQLDLRRRVERFHLAPKRQEPVSCLLVRRERDELEASDVNAPLRPVQPECDGTGVEFDRDVRALGQRGELSLLLLGEGQPRAFSRRDQLLGDEAQVSQPGGSFGDVFGRAFGRGREGLCHAPLAHAGL